MTVHQILEVPFLFLGLQVPGGIHEIAERLLTRARDHVRGHPRCDVSCVRLKPQPGEGDDERNGQQLAHTQRGLDRSSVDLDDVRACGDHQCGLDHEEQDACLGESAKESGQPERDHLLAGRCEQRTHPLADLFQIRQHPSGHVALEPLVGNAIRLPMQRNRCNEVPRGATPVPR